jgi:hypothetical protein
MDNALNHSDSTSPSKATQTLELVTTSPSNSGISPSQTSNRFSTRQWQNGQLPNIREIFQEIRENSDSLPVAIFENVQFEQFATLKDQSLFHYLQFDESSNRIFVVEMPSDQHEIWPSNLVIDLRNRYSTLISKGRSDVHYGDHGRWLEPDESFYLSQIKKHKDFDTGRFNDTQGSLAPVLIIESVKSASLNETIKKFHNYFSVEGCRVG